MVDQTDEKIRAAEKKAFDDSLLSLETAKKTEQEKINDLNKAKNALAECILKLKDVSKSVDTAVNESQKIIATENQKLSNAESTLRQAKTSLTLAENKVKSAENALKIATNILTDRESFLERVSASAISLESDAKRIAEDAKTWEATVKKAEESVQKALTDLKKAQENRKTLERNLENSKGMATSVILPLQTAVANAKTEETSKETVYNNALKNATLQTQLGVQKKASVAEVTKNATERREQTNKTITEIVDSKKTVAEKTKEVATAKAEVTSLTKTIAEKEKAYSEVKAATEKEVKAQQEKLIAITSPKTAAEAAVKKAEEAVKKAEDALKVATDNVKKSIEKLKKAIAPWMRVRELPDVNSTIRRILIGCSLYTAGDLKKAIGSTIKDKAVESTKLVKITGITKERSNIIVDWIEFVNIPSEYSSLPGIDPKDLVLVSELSGVDEVLRDQLFRNSIQTIGDLKKIAVSKDHKTLNAEVLTTMGISKKDAANLIEQIDANNIPSEYSEDLGFIISTQFDTRKGVRTLHGLTMALEDRLSKRSIHTIADLNNATKTREEREGLSKDVETSINDIQYFAIQADLLNIPDMRPDIADAIIISGFTSVKELSKISHMPAADLNVAYSGIPTFELCVCSKQAKYLDTGFEPGIPLIDDELTPSAINSSQFYANLPEVISQLGIGIGQAQRELDLHAIDVQNSILKDNELAEYGINATWYTMPEITFDLRMRYTVYEERSEKSEVAIKKVELIPADASFRTKFTSIALKEESALSIKFQPVPSPLASIKRLEVPDLYGMTRKEAMDLFSGTTVKMNIDDRTEPDTEDKLTMVIDQSIEPGCFILEDEELSITIERRSV